MNIFRKLQILWMIYLGISPAFAEEENIYLIQQDDVLSQIAADYIGRPIFTPDGSLMKILELNPEIKDPDLIRVKQRIRLLEIVDTWNRKFFVQFLYEPRFFSVTQNLANTVSDFKASGTLYQDFQVKTLFVLNGLWEFGAGVKFYSLGNPAGDENHFTIGKSDANFWSPRGSFGFRIFPSSKLMITPYVQYSRKPFFHFAFDTNTAISLHRTALNLIEPGVRFTFRPLHTTLTFEYQKGQSFQGWKAEALWNRMFARSQFSLLVGAAFEQATSDFRIQSDQWNQKSLAVQGMLGVQFHAR